MKTIGIVCNNAITRNNIIETLQYKGLTGVTIHSASNFDPEIFQCFFVDLNSPFAFLTLVRSPEKCIAFASPDDRENLQKAKALGCGKIYKNGQFFKEILPNFSLP